MNALTTYEAKYVENVDAVIGLGRYIEMRMRRVHLSMRTEDIKAFSERIRCCSVDGRKRCEKDRCACKSFLKTEQNSSVGGISVDGA